MTPSIGRIVHYRLSLIDCDEINRRRNDARCNAMANDGAIRHAGNDVLPGDVYPMTIVRVFDQSGGMVNGQVHLDGNDAYWATSRHEGAGEGEWFWPPRVETQAQTQAA